LVDLARVAVWIDQTCCGVLLGLVMFGRSCPLGGVYRPNMLLGGRVPRRWTMFG
jgi:hypothetical protein